MSRAAIRYAKAIIENAVSNGRADAVNQDMKLILTTVSSNEELQHFLKHNKNIQLLLKFLLQFNRTPKDCFYCLRKTNVLKF
jgi:F0F1-type ATP synthase delta subunit